MDRSEIIVKSPGRINLIGEHIDYNQGWVLPAAIDKHMFLTFRKNGSKNHCSIISEDFGETLSLNLEQLEKSDKGWHNYLIGVLCEIHERSAGLEGFECHIRSEIPVGSGVSSSAALECGFAFGLNSLFGLKLSNLELVQIGQSAEHRYVGTKCGIMDQFASVHGKAGHLIHLDCLTLDFEYIPMDLGDHCILLLNTNVAHDLATGAYNERRQECETSLDLLARTYGIEKSFREVRPHMLETVGTHLGIKAYKRCTYVIAEIARVSEAVKALKENDLKKLGELLYKTHEGLSILYEVSCPELDFLVRLAKSEPLILGARMMGGGFGGCTLNLIHKKAVPAFVERAKVAYESEFGNSLSHFQTVPGDGTALSPTS